MLNQTLLFVNGETEKYKENGITQI